MEEITLTTNTDFSTSQAKPFLFYFTFYYQDNDGFDREVTKSFVVTQLGMHNLLKDEYVERAIEYRKTHSYDQRCTPFAEFLSDYYDRYAEEIETQYGTHDCMLNPVDNIDSLGEVSYEVDESDIDDCTNRHRDVFVAQCGARYVSPIVDIRVNNNMNNYDIYLATIKKLGADWQK